MLAGVNKRPHYGLEKSTLKTRLGSVVDLQEGEEIEYIRKGITRDVKKLIEHNIHKLRNHFNDCDKHETGARCPPAAMALSRRRVGRLPSRAPLTASLLLAVAVSSLDQDTYPKRPSEMPSP